MHVQYVLFFVTHLDEIFEVCIYIYIYHIDEILQQHRWHIYDILMQQRWFHATAVGRRDRQQWRKHFQGKTTPIDRRYNKRNHQKKKKTKKTKIQQL